MLRLVNCIYGAVFHNAGRYMVYDPDDFDFLLGQKWILPEKTT